MSRPQKWRKVCCLPDRNKFGPLGQSSAEKASDVINMTVDEYETIRLIDFEGLTQEQCATQMNVARTTVQGIYTEARKKIGASLVNGSILHIEGGAYRLCESFGGCGRSCHRIKTTNLEGSIMKIAIPVDEKNMDTKICVSFGRAPYFLIYDTETKKAVFHENAAATSPGGAGIKAAQAIVDTGAGILLTPRCGQNAADVLIAAGIKLYKTSGDSAISNISDYDAGKLSPLKDIHEGFHGAGGR